MQHLILFTELIAQIGTALETFVLAMTLYPDVLRKAQKEIDSVIGLDRQPVLADMASLPYIEAIVKETLRWNVILPTGKCVIA